MYQPLEQFVIFYTKFIDCPYYFFLVNETFFTLVLLFLFFAWGNSLFFNVRFFTHNFVGIVSKLLNEVLNVVKFQSSFIFILYLSTFFFILICNILGLLPLQTCWSTQFFSNFMISFTLIIGLTLYNFDKNGKEFFSLFIPQNVPFFLKYPLFCLELLSYFIRIFSLSIRLFSNMVAGHSLLHILFEMSRNINSFIELSLVSFYFLNVGILFTVSIVFFFEVVVAFLQAYVFSIMFSIYSNDLYVQH